jgi:uncharacterized protein Yka (UPF0111/DUF47 family)
MEVKMKESDYMKGLARYLVKRDEHLGLNMEQARQLVKYIRQYEDKCDMIHMRDYYGYWEDEDEKK